MNEIRNKKQDVLIIILVLGILLFSVIGITFSFFKVEVIGNEEASSVLIRTEKLGVIVFKNGSEVSIDNAYPGAFLEKEFTVSLEESDDDTIVSYYLYLDIAWNEFNDSNNEIIDFIHRIKSAESLENREGTILGEMDWQTVPSKENTEPLFKARFVGNDTHTYVYQIGLEETNVEQNDAQDLRFAGKLRIESEGDKFTAYGSIWSGEVSSFD